MAAGCWSPSLQRVPSPQTGVLTPLSQQVLIDCSWGFGNYACDGGEEWRAYEWIKKHGGIASTESYGPYLGQVRVPGGLCAPTLHPGNLSRTPVPPPCPPQNGYCHCNQSELVAPLAGYVNVEPGSATALKAALVKHGPVAVNIDASHKSFAFYANGVYEEPRCGELGGRRGGGHPVGSLSPSRGLGLAPWGRNVGAGLAEGLHPEQGWSWRRQPFNSFPPPRE